MAAGPGTAPRRGRRRGTAAGPARGRPLTLRTPPPALQGFRRSTESHGRSYSPDSSIKTARTREKLSETQVQLRKGKPAASESRVPHGPGAWISESTFKIVT